MTFPLAGGRRLLLAGGGQAGLWLAVGAAALVLLLMLYRYERRLVSRGTGLGLLGLRLLAAGILVASLFEPIAARSYRETIRGRVIVGVDLSASMATVDAGRSDDDRRRLAKALSLSPAEPPEILTRREIARRLLEGDAMTRIAADHTVEAVGFARDLVPGRLAALAKTLGQAPRPDDPAGTVTDWTPALALALKDTEKPVLGVVLLTDGQQNAGDPDNVADRLAARGIPVYPILIGSTTPPRDVAIAAVKAPESVYKGDVASIEVTLKADGFPGAEIPVTLERPGAPPLRQTVRAPEDGSRPVVTFRVPLDAVGRQAMTVAAAPPPGDARPDNDRRTVRVQVADDKARVLLVDGAARWEFRYLRNALARDPRVQLESVVFHQPTSAASTDTTYAVALPARSEAPGTPADPLGGFDAIVIGDVAAGDLPTEAWARLDAYVAERGGTLILSPGPGSWPAAHADPAIHKLLPVTEPRLVPVDPEAIDPAHPALPPGVAVVPADAADAQSWPMFQLAADPARSRAIWAELPRLPWVLAGKAKPGATVLATAAGGGLENHDAAVIAAHPYGLGKVLWVGTDGTWRWRHRVGDAYHHRFWGQVVRWAASGKLMAGNRFVRFGPLRPQVAEGQGARLQARIADGVAGVGPDLLVAARVFKKTEPNGDAVAVVPLRPTAGQPRTFEGIAPNLPVGEYVIRLDVPQLADTLSAEPLPDAALEVAARDTPERIELAARRDPLDRLANATGGRVFADHEAARLPDLLRGRTVERVRTEETTLWDKPGPLLLFFVLLTTEWVIRKRVGLP